MRIGWGYVVSGVLGLLGIYLAAVWTTTGQRVDDALTARVRAGEDVAPLLLEVVHLIGPMTMVSVVALVVVAGLFTRGWRAALAASAGVAVCLITPQVLKAVLPRPELAVSWPLPNTLPSGHTAAVIAVVVALLVLAPQSLRLPVLLAGVVAATVMGYLMVALPHHRVSDVIASGAVGITGYGVALLVRWATTSTKT
ncbi:phosphatase PAP2 family protein [Ornithinimicrobium pratense]|uniref:Phosphatase PAP2 family protein n=1 Tax=Ornithinimicrobium pratense TaxID=2593973 RepID=A0A5J6V9F0_9MICO|nr:phosphatase PAP2 family protein [Ornithinimicrobium pratense]QFG69763.1 phosphatase PAP2 family protein [Ornithinimicrobium pratense]